jgi:alpha-tubulin suppressor-like RCC1 family protein
LRRDGTVVAWGCGGGRDPGLCTVPAGLADVTAIAVGAHHNLALRRDGSIIAWGCRADPHFFTDFGQCSVPAGLSGITAIAAGDSHSLALKADGTVIAWGCGPDFLGHSHDGGQCSVPPGLTGVTSIAAGLVYHSLALKTDGSVGAWGCIAGPVFFRPDFGQCGVPTLSGLTVVAAGFAHNLAVRRDRTVVAWGCGVNLDLGQCSVPSGLSNVTAVAAGFAHSLALVGPTPSISLLRTRASGNKAVVEVKVTGWKMYPSLVGQLPNKPDGGHWRIFVDGKYNNLSTSPTTGRTTKLKPGKHTIWAKLANNDDSDVAGSRRSRTVTVIIKRRA